MCVPIRLPVQQCTVVATSKINTKDRQQTDVMEQKRLKTTNEWMNGKR